MKTAAIVVGHGPRIDKGAVNKHTGTTEFDWNKDLCIKIYERLKHDDRVKPVLIYRRVEKVAPYHAVNEVDADFAVEFHLNAFDGNASGTEMIHYPGSSKGARLAGVLLVNVVDVLQLPNRGVKTPWAGRGNAFLGKTKCPAVIAESFFIDNDIDLLTANLKKDELVDAYANALVKYAE